MVGLSDIPCVRVAVQKISESTVEAAIRGLRYSLCHKSLVNQLNSEIENVNIQEDAVSRKVDAARTDGKTIEKHVLKWQEEVETMKTLANELSRQRTSFTCFKVLPFPNLVSRFRLGRKAAHQSKNVADLTVSGRELVANEVGYLPDVENLPNSNTTYHSFASREEAYGKLWEALVDKKGDPVIGIYGMPGVGKTRMMEQAWKDTKDKNIFDKVVRVNVSEKFDVLSLQDKLAAFLDCHLESKDETRRAYQLKGCLMNGGKTLVILDDVWDVIPLNRVGIPFGDGSFKGCKILLTSRKQDICLRNNCRDPVEIKTLTDGEAWEMFKNTVGSSKIETLKDALLAKKVCRKCAALPLLIDAVGNALKFVTENLWADALYQLENHKFEEIEGIDRQVYACLHLSFEKLNVEARRCLLLCSLFPEDHDIEIKMLFYLATGSQLLDHGRNIHAVIDILKSSSLLLHEVDDDTVKLHDIIRDVARSIAAREPTYAVLSIRCRTGLLDNIDYPKPRLLQLDLEEDNVRFPDDLVFPDLHTLWLRGHGKRIQLSSGFFERFMNVKFLVLEGMSFPDQQQISIHRLDKLRVVILNDCDIQQTFISSISRNLETLCIWNGDLPGTIELPELKDLRKLELLHNSDFDLEEKVISGLSGLEELHILGEFRFSDDADGNFTSIFGQLSQLTRFRNLSIALNSSHPYPDEDLVNKLVKFHIYVGFLDSVHHSHSLRDSSKKLIWLKESDMENGWMALVERAENVLLYRVIGFANGFGNSNLKREAFADLRELKIRNCDDIKNLARWDGRNQQLKSSFSNLTIVEISGCGKLKYVFSASAAKCLRQMQQLDVHNCPALEEIIMVEEDQGEIISFPELKVLHLQRLHSITSFSTDKVTFPNVEKMTLGGLNSCFTTQNIHLGQDDSPPKLNTLYLYSSNQEVELSSQWLLQLENIETLQLTGCRWVGDSVFNGTTFFRRLRVLEIENCGDISLFQCSSLTFLQQLQTLKVSDCPLLKEILWGDEPLGTTTDHNTTISLPRLQSLILEKLPKLKNPGIFACSMPALEELMIDNCGFSTLFTSSAFMSLQKLQYIDVSGCALLESIVEDEKHDGTPKNTISLLCLSDITLKCLASLKSFSSSSVYAFNMPALEDVTVYNCPLMHTFSLSEVIMPVVNFKSLGHHYTKISDLNRLVKEEVYGVEAE